MDRILIVGAGLYGSTLARLLAESGITVHVIEKRDHVAGNAFDYCNQHGIRIHKYGPHIFHTNNKYVFDWLGNFTNWIPYDHKVRALLSDGREVTLPPNLETADLVGAENIVDVLYRPYTRKMWNLEIEQIDPSVLKRVSIRDDYNVSYFPNDRYQAIPDLGYTAMVQKILSHGNITVSLNTPFSKEIEKEYDYIFNSMPIDEYYDFIFGELPYRSIKFHHFDLDVPSILSVPTLNFTHDGPFTRVTEWKKYPNHGHNIYKTSITLEEPCDYRSNNLERYYPVKDISGINRDIYQKYFEIPNPKMTFIGRCGLYVYIDMHQAVNSAMKLAEKFLKRVGE